MRKMPRGEPQAALREFITPYLVTDQQSEKFLYIHRTEAALRQHSAGLGAISEAQFVGFLRYEAAALQDTYLRYKAQGYTGCYAVSAEVTARLNRIKPGCAEAIVAARGEHQYTGVAIDSRYYIVDFTADQFLAYPEIIQRSGGRNGSGNAVLFDQDNQRDSSPPTYAGVLILPCYRCSL
jgi:hypothetical protein